MSSIDIKRKLEDALEVVITEYGSEEIAALTIYKGLSGTALVSPRIQIVAHTAKPRRYGGVNTGLYDMEMDCYVVTNVGDTSRTELAELCGEFEEVLSIDNIEELLTDAGNTFAVHPDLFFLDSIQDSASESEVWTQYKFTLVCSHGLTSDVFSSSSSSSD